MEQFLGFAIPGIPYGCTYAIVAVALVLTYRATGVFNFAFAAQAYVASLLFTALIQSAHLSAWLAFVIAVVVVSPLLGLAFDRLLFSRIPNSNNMAKLVSAISLLVGIPALLQVFIPQNYYAPPSIVFNPNTVYFTLAGAPFNGLDMSAVVFTSLVLLAMGVMMRFTPLGLQMRGAVESRRLVQLDGVNAGGVVAVAWVISSFLAGLAGVLLAPNFSQVQAQPFLTLMVAAIAAAACAAFRSMTIAAVAAVIIGIATFTLQGYLPTQSFLFTSILPSLPFLVLVGALLFHPGMRTLEQATDPLASVDPPLPPLAAAVRTPAMGRVISVLWYVLLGLFIVSMLTWMPRDWESVLNQGLAFSTLFLSITLITGMGGQLSLAQAGLAGVGAFTAAQLANHLGLSMMVGMLVGAAFAAGVAVVLAVLSLRLRGLGLALMTLGAALVFDNVIQSSQTLGGGSGGLGPMNNVELGQPVRPAQPQRSCTVPHHVLRSGRDHCGDSDDAPRHRGPTSRCHARERDGCRRNRHQPDVAAHSHLRPFGRGGGDRGHLARRTAGCRQSPAVQLRLQPGVRRHRGDHRGHDCGRGHSGSLRVRHHPEAPRVRAPAIRQPDVRAVCLWRPDLRQAPRGHPGVSEATVHAAI